ncbi:hypothetical protein NSE01_05590 [Novosphingobium sediminis]|uniref:Uncharacterized protein n=1 Tax=Novosphingobium sediminis TaxID=707214 RepID=A0A512AGD7_9SPHN|nr:hypothetical protein NSE01_05590 [Novosphingobium sediminis]
MIVAARGWSERVSPRTSFADPPTLRLREPTGQDELSLEGIDTRAATRLLTRLADPPDAIVALSASDRDLLLAALHRGLWGDRIVSSLECAACGAPYDLSFTLSDLQRQIESARAPSEVIALRTLEDGSAVIYLPSAEEEDAAAQAGPLAGQAQLANAMIGDGGPIPADLDERLEALAPLLDVDLEAPCAECGHEALARFDIQTFTLQRLLDEREAVLGEVHELASGYHWGLAEILSLPRGVRRSFAHRLGAAE